MTVETKYLTTLVELAHRRRAPQSADLQRGLHLARLFEADPSTPIALRSLAWHVITESHEAAGWPMPDGERFPACCGAAASAKHGSAMLIQEIAEQTPTITGPTLLLGALAASRSVFGDWNILPAAGAYIVPLDSATGGRPPACVYLSSVGVRWGAPGELRDIFLQHSTPATLAGLEILIPAPELITARTAGCVNKPNELEYLIFAAAAFDAVNSDSWDNALSIAPCLGQKNRPLATAMRLGIDKWLGLSISAPRRVVLLLRRLLRPGRAA